MARPTGRPMCASAGAAACGRRACLLTRRMLHGLRGAPAAYPVEAAVRWAQARAFGADAAAAEAIVATPLGRDLGDWDYWEPFVRLVSRARSVPLHQIGPLADFVRLRRLNGEGAVSFRGRTGASLLQMMEDWHRDLHRRQTPFVRFAKARINEVAFELEFEGVTAGWRFLRLQDSHALAEEGRLMRHCVASRTHACRSGRHSVWRAVRTLEGREEHCLTLEVTRQGVPVEVRGLANRWPAPAESAAVNLFLRRLGEAAADTAGKAP